MVLNSTYNTLLNMAAQDVTHICIVTVEDPITCSSMHYYYWCVMHAWVWSIKLGARMCEDRTIIQEENSEGKAARNV